MLFDVAFKLLIDLVEQLKLGSFVAISHFTFDEWVELRLHHVRRSLDDLSVNLVLCVDRLQSRHE